jgi:hypothetical protein
MQDGEIRQLAVKIVSAQYEWTEHPRTGRRLPVVRAWKETFHAPVDRRCKAEDDECEVQLIWEFVKKNCRYVFDPTDADFFATARATLEAGGGDCDDFVILFGALLTSIGFQCVARVISTKEAPSQWSHTYPLVGLPKDNPTGWVPLDATVPESEPGWQFPGMARYRDYPL